MTDLYMFENFELITVIANYGHGSKILRYAKNNGITGGTVFFGKGTVKNSLLNFFSLYDERKEILMLASDHEHASEFLKKMDEEFEFYKPHHGVAFSSPIRNIIGSHFFEEKTKEEEREVVETMNQLIITIVNRGDAEDVIEAANAAGAKGGTIINARGSGANETKRVFNMEIEPEKDMVWILSESELAPAIMENIRQKLDLHLAGSGIIFTVNVTDVYGIRK